MGVINPGYKAFIAGEALAAHRRVKIESGTTMTPPEVVYADAGEACIGVTLNAAADGDVVLVRSLVGEGSYYATAKEAFAIGATLYGGDDGKVQDTSSGTAQMIALEAATAEGDIVEAMTFPSVSTTAATVSVADSGSLFTATTVEAALAELMTAIKMAQYTLFPQVITLEDGTAIGKFSSEDAASCGWTQLSNKELALRWNNHATPAKVALQFAMPQDLDDAAAAVLHLLGAIVKAGADEADSPVFTVEGYFQTAGADPAADTNCGGESGEFLTTADAAYQEKTLSIAAADVPAAPAVLTLIINPKDGQLGTDDFVLAIPWLEVTRKALTS